MIVYLCLDLVAEISQLDNYVIFRNKNFSQKQVISFLYCILFEDCYFHVTSNLCHLSQAWFFTAHLLL
jgi:hypothetical protein